MSSLHIYNNSLHDSWKQKLGHRKQMWLHKAWGSLTTHNMAPATKTNIFEHVLSQNTTSILQYRRDVNIAAASVCGPSWWLSPWREQSNRGIEASKRGKNKFMFTWKNWPGSSWKTQKLGSKCERIEMIFFFFLLLSPYLSSFLFRFAAPSQKLSVEIVYFSPVPLQGVTPFF